MAGPGEDGAEIRPFRDADEFDAWLAEHHGEPAGVWLKLAKASSGIPSMTSDEAVDVGLCWGWISGQRRGLDDDWYLQKYVPRRPRSRWSQVNVRKVAELTDAGRMRQPGIAEVEAAQADGRWDAAYVSQKEFTVPDDLRAALDADPAAAAAYDALGRTEQYAVVLDLVTARDPDARRARLERAVARRAGHLVLQLAQDPGQVLAVGLGEPLEQLLRRHSPGPAHLLGQRAPAVGERDQGGPAVPRVGRASDQPLLLEGVHHLGRRPGCDPKVLGQLLRAHSPAVAGWPAPGSPAPGTA